MEPGEASERVKRIVDAAERAARQLREQAEERAAERIAEADRAAANRVQAAEQEAEEVLADARARAEQARNEALAAVGATHAEADERVREADQLRTKGHEGAGAGSRRDRTDQRASRTNARPCPRRS